MPRLKVKLHKIKYLLHNTIKTDKLLIHWLRVRFLHVPPLQSNTYLFSFLCRKSKILLYSKQLTI